MKRNIFKYFALGALVAVSFASCDDFLDRPSEDNYNQDNYYQTDDQCISGVNYLYNSPWYDFQRGFLKVAEEMAGNYMFGTTSPYHTFTINGSDQDLVNMSYSLWAEIGHCNAVYDNIKASSGNLTPSVRNQCLGECLAWKAMAYFFLVRTFGEVPILHNNTASLNAGDYNTYPKNYKSDIYEYIIYTLETAMDLLPAKGSKGRLDYYCAEGLLAKVYLAKAGVTGTLNADDLKKAADYAKDVIDNSGRKLEDNYEDIFLLKNRYTEEGLFVWRWTADGANWTRQNSYQSDLGMGGIDDWAATWGDWGGLTVDMQEAFGIKLLEQQPDAWLSNVDSRLHATMMLPGFKYSQFWQDKGGFDYLEFLYEYATNEGLNSPTGANTVKHLYGDTYDHIQGAGCSDARMASSVPTFLLRLADVYLIYAEASLGASRSASSNADVIDAFMAVRNRAIPGANRPASVTWEDIWKERRLELCMEGDRWYDFVRVSYYDPDFCVKELTAQKRNEFWGLADVYETYYKSGTWDASAASYNDGTTAPNVASLMKGDNETPNYFFLPFPTEDVTFNPLLGSDVNAEGDHVDVRTVYAY
jgi:hypothetical protein